MITINLDPTLLSWASINIRWFGIATLLAVILGVIVASRELARRDIVADEVYSAAIWAVIAGAIGARLVHILGRLDDFRRAPQAMLSLQEGGLSIFGALIGGAVALLIYARLRRLNIGDVFDAAAPALLFGQSVGRIGSLLTGSAQGTPTLLPWGVAYTNRDSLAPMLGVYGHPFAAYEILWNLAVLGVLLVLRRRIQTPGTVFLLYAGLYSAGRLVLDTFRLEPKVWLGLQQAQVLAAAVLLVIAVLLIRQLLLSTPAGQLGAAPVSSEPREVAGEHTP